MRKIGFYYFALLLLLRPFPVVAQPDTSSTVIILNDEREDFLRHLKSISIDSVIVNPLAHYFESEVNSIYSFIISDTAVPTDGKEKAVRSLVYFIKELSKNIAQQKSDIYDIPGALQSYKSILTALVYHKPFTEILIPLEPRRSQLLTTAFSQYKEYPLLDDIAVYKRVASSPDFILQFLENKPGFPFADSLLLNAAAHDPFKLIYYLNKDNPGVQDKIRNTKNIYVQQIVSLSKDKNASELLPFVTQIAEKRITPE